VALLASLTASACDRAEEGGAALHDRSLADTPGFDPEAQLEVLLPKTGEPVVATEELVSPTGETLFAAVNGTLSSMEALRVARPWSHLHEDDVFVELATELRDEEGNIRRLYEVRRFPNPSPATLDIEHAPAGGPLVADAVLEMVGSNETPVRVMVKIAEMPPWDVPVRPHANTLSPEDLATQLQAREDAIAQRVVAFDTLLQPLETTVASLGGAVRTRWPRTGWAVVELGSEHLPLLFERDDLVRITSASSDATEDGWRLGVGRRSSRLNADVFIGAGYTGERSNPARHSWNDITVGVSEVNLFEDEACFFYDTADCSKITGSSRIRRRMDCADADGNGNYCEVTSDFADVDSNSGHGTIVTSILGGDYQDGQATFDVGAPTSNPDWKSHASGVAPEIGFILYGGFGSSDDVCAAATDSIDDAIDHNVDVLNMSWGVSCGMPSCNAIPDTAVDAEIQLAYDDGIFLTKSAGNNNSTSTCQLTSPGDIIKAFTVNGYDASTNDCTSSPATYCLMDQTPTGSSNEASTRGGVNVKAAGATRSQALRGVDVAGPSGVYYYTAATGFYGKVISGTSESLEAHGTSHATPHVAGMAALVKDWYLAAGHSWINSPGRLHTVMLAMADRHYSTSAYDTSVQTIQRTTGGSVYYGFGKAKLRGLASSMDTGQYGNSMITLSFTSDGQSYTYTPFTQMGSSAELLKCVMMQHENMSTTKDEVSYVTLTVRVRDTCSSGSVVSRGDSSYDVKKQVAFEDSEVGVSLGGKCAEVQVYGADVTSFGVSMNVMCYWADVTDDAA
jgi:hypothetical protein